VRTCGDQVQWLGSRGLGASATGGTPASALRDSHLSFHYHFELPASMDRVELLHATALSELQLAAQELRCVIDSNSSSGAEPPPVLSRARVKQLHRPPGIMTSIIRTRCGHMVVSPR
jgi:hypothetical protein